jgi:hypothetical protein
MLMLTDVKVAIGVVEVAVLPDEAKLLIKLPFTRGNRLRTGRFIWILGEVDVMPDSWLQVPTKSGGWEINPTIPGHSNQRAEGAGLQSRGLESAGQLREVWSVSQRLHQQQVHFAALSLGVQYNLQGLARFYWPDSVESRYLDSEILLAI